MEQAKYTVRRGVWLALAGMVVGLLGGYVFVTTGGCMGLSLSLAGMLLGLAAIAFPQRSIVLGFAAIIFSVPPLALTVLVMLSGIGC